MRKYKLFISIFIVLLFFYFIDSIIFNKSDIKNNGKIEISTTKPTTLIVIENSKTIIEKKIVKPIEKQKIIKPILIEEPAKVENLDIKSLPKNISEVKMTPKLQDFFNKYWDGSTEKIDFRLKLFDRLSQCLGPKAPTSGKITMNFLFKSDIKSKTAIGVDARDDNQFDQQSAFQIRKSTLSSDDEEIFNLCIRESHIDLTMNIADKMNEPNSTVQEYFYHPISIEFPIENDIIYWLLSHEGEPRP